MAEATYKKLDLAMELLDEAIRHFLDRKSYACSLNLAGVAEEVLGRTVDLSGGESSLAQRVKDHLRIHNAFGTKKLKAKESRDRQNRAKNSIKHLNDTNDAEITLDLEDEAIEMLNRAACRIRMRSADSTIGTWRTALVSNGALVSDACASALRAFFQRQRIASSHWFSELRMLSNDAIDSDTYSAPLRAPYGARHRGR